MPASGRAPSRSAELVESRPALVSLSREESAQLIALGKKLASSQTFWGTDPDAAEDGLTTRSVIRCVQSGQEEYQVTVIDAVGIVALPSIQLVVRPKIPQSHLVYLLLRSQAFPRTERGDAAAVAPDQTLWGLVATWFLMALEDVLRKGLLNDYNARVEDLALARGRIITVPTATNYYQGRIMAACEFDEFDLNSPLNRVLASAARAIAGSPVLKQDLRFRARRALTRMDDIGPMTSGDLRASTDRRSHYYDDALVLAHHVLAATGRTTLAGNERAWTFLVRTPELIEEGLRTVLRSGLAPEVKVSKKGIQLAPSTLRLNPDLVFGDVLAVGDVKYKLIGREWIRSDLYQVTTFAAGFRVPAGGVFAFEGSETERPPALTIGPLEVRMFRWTTRDGISPEVAAEELVGETGEWLQSLSRDRDAVHQPANR